MIRLAARLGVGGGTETVVRQVVTALAVSLGVALLLFAGVAFPALHAHDVRGGWLDTRAHNSQPAQDESTTDPLLWRRSQDRYRGRTIERIDLAALGPHAPVPPGVSRLPGAGELAVSPALAGLLHDVPANQLGARFPGRVVETIGHDALEAPNDLIVLVGHTPDELRTAAFVDVVHSIEAKPVSHSETRLARVAIFLGGMGLLVQIIVFVSTATRLAAARREQRLAALRLAGATPGQTNLLAAVEAAIAAVVGVAIGFVLFLVLRPHVANIPFDGKTFFPSDLRLRAGTAVGVALLVPTLAMLAAVVTLRRVRISPLGVSRVAVPSVPRPRRLLIIVVGFVLFFLTLLWANGNGRGMTPLYAMAGAFAVIVLGVFASGSWMTAVVARVLGRLGRTTPVLLASRRLRDNPKGAFRAIGGLTLAVFLSTAFSGIAASALADASRNRGSDGFPPNMLTALPRTAVLGGVPAAAADRAIAQLRATPGVNHVADVRALPVDVTTSGGPPAPGPDPARVFRPTVMRCVDAPLLRLPRCDGTVVTGPKLGPNGAGTLTPSRPIAVRELDGLPLLAIGVGTNGDRTTIERARTIIGALGPGLTATTGAEDAYDDAQTIHTIERMSDAGLGFVLVIAGCSLAVAVAGGLVERKRPFALLRLSGMRLRELHRIVLAEAGGPLLVVSAGSALVGMAVAAMVLAVVGATQWRLPSVGYWTALLGGLAFSMAVVASTLPLLDRLTSLESARFE